MNKANLLIAEGRNTKTEGRAADLFDQAFEIVTDLLAEIAPSRFIFQGTIWVIGIFITGVITALIVNW